MINSKTLREYVESLFDNEREPNSEGIHIRMKDNSFVTIKLNVNRNENVEITANNIKMGYFEENIEIGKNQYAYTFHKNDKNCRAYSEYYDLINCRFEEFNIFTTKL